MMSYLCRQVVPLLAVVGCLVSPARAQSLDQIGVTALRAATTNLDGRGIRVAQPEANFDLGTNWEVNPVAVGQPASLFAYHSALGSSTNFPNSLSSESGHADGVGANFYGRTGIGVATNVAHVDNYEAEFFITNYIFNLAPMPAAAVVNQSFTFGLLTVGDQQLVDAAYDDYSELYQTLFVSPAGNGGNVYAPGTSYNCICVAAYGGGSGVGPTIDNGRCKPDITAPAGETSFSTPQVAGAAAVLMQAALRGDGGGDTNAAADIRTIKALLLNGAVKPANWTNSSVIPLDARYGAGVLNVFNSYQQLAGGKHAASATNLIALDAAHPPAAVTNTVPASHAWDFAVIVSGETNDVVHHYFLNVSNVFATVTLAWNRQLNQPGVNDLDLYLYDCASSNLVASSISYVNNVEYLWVTNLPAGRYDLQVVKYGGTNVVSNAETYALAWEFVPPPVLAISGHPNPALNWPLYPAGFVVEARTNLAAGAWSTNSLPASAITNGQNRLLLNGTNAGQFFRLRRP